jgi:hypothetical protein
MKGLDFAKKLFVCFTVIGLTLVFYSYSSADLSDGLVAYYPFNGNANDESGNGNDGTVNGATLTQDRFGNENSAYSFDGVDDYIDIGNNSTLKPQLPVTISLWVNLNENSTDDFLFSNNFTNDSYSGVFISVANDLGTVGIHFGDGGYPSPQNRRTKWGTSIIEVGEWYHIAGVLRSFSDMDIYINATNDGGNYEGYASSLEYDSNSGNIGRMDQSSFNPPVYSYSTIDDIRFYNRALSEDEIESLYTGELPCADNDGDGYYVEEGCGTEIDCNDDDYTINPGIDRDLYGDGVDDDCDGEIDEDAPFCNVVSVTPDDLFIGFGLLPRFRLVRIVGGGVDFDNEGDVLFSSDNVLVIGSRATSDSEISALIFITPRADTGRFDVSVGDCIGKRVIDLSKWWWN